MEDKELLDKLADLEDPDYGRLYIEWGGFKDSRGVNYDEREGRWVFVDGVHSYPFQCDSFREALSYLVDPPGEQLWEENIYKYHGEPSVEGMKQGEHP